MTQFDPSRFAVIADIHSNLDALVAVLADIDAQGIASIVNLGDHLSGPMAPRETAALVMARGMISVRGNHDRWILETPRAEMHSIDRIARDQLGAEHLDWLAALPAELWVAEDIYACHGTPRDDNRYWMEDVTEAGAVVMRGRDGVMQEAEGIAASLMLCAHTHLPRRMDLPDGRVILNPGSVGCPAYTDDLPYAHKVETGTPAACYAIAERMGEGWQTTFRHVPYDPARMIAMAKENDHPGWEARLATGWVEWLPPACSASALLARP